MTIPLRDGIDRNNGMISLEHKELLKQTLSKLMQATARQFGTDGISFFGGGTEPFRVAKNGAQVLSELGAELGIRLEVLSHTDEAVTCSLPNCVKINAKVLMYQEVSECDHLSPGNSGMSGLN